MVEELRNLLSNMFSPLAAMTDVLEPSALNRITGEELLYLMDDDVFSKHFGNCTFYSVNLQTSLSQSCLQLM